LRTEGFAPKAGHAYQLPGLKQPNTSGVRLQYIVGGAANAGFSTPGEFIQIKGVLADKGGLHPGVDLFVARGIMLYNLAIKSTGGDRVR